jgi:hypothetical protein
MRPLFIPECGEMLSAPSYLLRPDFASRPQAEKRPNQSRNANDDEPIAFL